jgi:adenylate cyclase
VRSVTLAGLAEEAAAPIALVEHLVAIGQIRPLPDGRFDPREAAIVTTVQALLDAGIADDDLTWAVREAGAGFAAIGRLFEAPEPRSTRTYDDLRRSLGATGERLGAIYTAFGLVEPAPDRHLRLDEEEVIRGFAEIWHLADPTGDTDLRVARLSGESSRRWAEGWLDAWDETTRPELASQGAPRTNLERPDFDPADPEHNPSLRGAVVIRRLVAWLYERQLERTLHQRVIDAFEGMLVGAGRLPARPDAPPAVAFVDLSGFTSMTESRGDEAAAAVAVRLNDLAHDAAAASGGRVVKLLGDGVLMRFASSASAILAVLDLVERAPASDIGEAHAGVAAGRLVIRDGDVFGRVVNLAARVAGQAGPGEVVVEEGAVIALPAGTARFEPMGRFELKGIATPVSLWRARAIEGR